MLSQVGPSPVLLGPSPVLLEQSSFKVKLHLHTEQGREPAGKKQSVVNPPCRSTANIPLKTSSGKTGTHTHITRVTRVTNPKRVKTYIFNFVFYICFEYLAAGAAKHREHGIGIWKKWRGCSEKAGGLLENRRGVIDTPIFGFVLLDKPFFGL